jgi:cytochrome c biogenesis protein
MATSEREMPPEVQPPSTSATVKAAAKKDQSILDKILGLLSSVRFGVTMLSIVLIFAMIGMLIMQQQVDGFQQYYNERLTPAQRLIYGKLLFFDIYHAWYFSLLLAITGLNIILASIDRFPTAWQYVAKPKLNASPNFTKAQMFTAEAQSGETPAAFAERVRQSWRKLGFRPRVNEQNDRITVFAQKNVWNRLGAYSVHVALLTIFTGGVLTARLGVGGMMDIRPGMSSNKINMTDLTLDGPVSAQAEIPFTIECTDVQQKLIRPEGGLDQSNTIDWLTYVKIKDGNSETPALIHLNFPHDYRGYRFFQSQFTAFGNAREITLSFEPVDGSTPLPPVAIRRNGAAEVPGIGLVAYKAFFPDFDIRARDSASGEYNNPVAQLEITAPDGTKRGALALNPHFAEQLLQPQSKDAAGDAALRDALLVNGNKVLMKSFEKAALGHILAVQYDPGRLPFYAGSSLLILSLCGVFFFSHQRVWAVIEPEAGGGSKAFFGGNVNRNRNGFEGRFNLLVQTVTGERRRDDE